VPYLVNRTTGEFSPLDPKQGRLSHLWRRCHTWATVLKAYLRRVGQGYRLAMLTLTYHGLDYDTGQPLPDFGWQPNHIRDFMKKLRYALRDRLLAYAWVAELQQRGAVHYHVLVLVRAGTPIPYPDQAGWWPHGSTRVETARTVFYIMKYAQKGQFVDENGGYLVFPKGLRLFSVWIGQDVISTTARWYFRTSAWPQWLVNVLLEFYTGAIPRRRVGGGWTIEDEEAGEVVLNSPWSFVLV
jgi:hypothetical protein